MNIETCMKRKMLKICIYSSSFRINLKNEELHIILSTPYQHNIFYYNWNMFEPFRKDLFIYHLVNMVKFNIKFS